MDPKIEMAITTSYNRWLGDIWSKGNGRLRWTVVLPFLSMAESLRELEWAKEHGGVVHRHGAQKDFVLSDALYSAYIGGIGAGKVHVRGRVGSTVLAARASRDDEGGDRRQDRRYDRETGRVVSETDHAGGTSSEAGGYAASTRRTSSRLRITGSLCSRAGRTKRSVGQSCFRVCS